MSVTNKLKWKRALSTLRFCYEELDYAKETSKAIAPEFEAFYRKFCAENNVNIQELNKQNKSRLDKLYGRQKIASSDTEDQPDVDTIGDTSIILHNNSAPQDSQEYEMTADDIAIHEAFSKLFKQIALKLHPDRIDKSLPDEEVKSRVNMFQTANTAFEQKKYYILLDIAEQNKIATPKNYDQQTRWMKNETAIVQQQIMAEKNTYNYGFAECENDEQKSQLIKKFIFQLFQINV